MQLSDRQHINLAIYFGYKYLTEVKVSINLLKTLTNLYLLKLNKISVNL